MSFVTSSCITSKVLFSGELGNQMFQTAAVLGYAVKFDVEPLIPNWICPWSGREYFKVFRNIKYCNSIKAHTRQYVQKDFGYEDLPLLKNVDLRGCFQSARFFSSWNSIQNSFALPGSYEESARQTLLSHGVEMPYTAVHMRFYDRPGIDQNSLLQTLPPGYFTKALHEASQRNLISGPIVIVSNNAFRARYTINTHMRFLDHAVVIGSTDNLLDLMILELANVVIISNSTFSWWGAFLNRKNAVVFGPRLSKWFSFFGQNDVFFKVTQDLYPSHYNQIDF